MLICDLVIIKKMIIIDNPDNNCKVMFCLTIGIPNTVNRILFSRLISREIFEHTVYPSGGMNYGMLLILIDPRMWYWTHGQEKELLESIESAFKPIECMPKSLKIDMNLIYK